MRIPQRSAINHIVAPNLVNVDPNLLWDKQTNTPIYKDDILEHLLKENENFINRNKFDYIVYYTDVKTFMTINFDYAFIFFLFDADFSEDSFNNCTYYPLRWVRKMEENSAFVCPGVSYLY